MIVEAKSDQPQTDDAIRAATGKTWEQWFAALDAFGAAVKGRRATGDHLVGELALDPYWSSTLVVEYEKARSIVEKDGRPKGYMICVSKTVAASADDAFSAFADPKALASWFGKGTTAEFQEGGRYQNDDGDRGTFKKIRPGKSLVFTWENPREEPGGVVEVKFQPSGKKLSVMVAHDRIQGRAHADGLRRGWGQALDALKARLEGKTA